MITSPSPFTETLNAHLKLAATYYHGANGGLRRVVHYLVVERIKHEDVVAGVTAIPEGPLNWSGWFPRKCVQIVSKITTPTIRKGITCIFFLVPYIIDKRELRLHVCKNCADNVSAA